MKLNDLIPYFELYRNIKGSGENVVLNEALQQKELEFIDKEISISGIVDEVDHQKNELIITYRDKGSEPGNLNNLISQHFFIFSSADHLSSIVNQFNIQKDNLVQVTGNIVSLHRNSALRISLLSISVLEKNIGLIKKSDRKGCFIATAVYGNHEAAEVQKFYELRDRILSKSFPGRLFIKVYYVVSPTLTKWIHDKPFIKSLIRKNILDKILAKF